MIKIIIRNSLTQLSFPNYEILTKAAPEINHILSYRKAGHYYLRKIMYDKFSKAQTLKQSMSLSQIKRQFPDIFKYCFVDKQNLETWVKKASIVNLYDIKSHLFPTGLISLVLKYLNENNYEYTIEDKRIKPEQDKYYPKQTTLPELRYYQKESLKHLEASPRGIIEAATGTGKTLIIKELIYQKGVKTLVVVPSSNILNIFDEQLTEVFGKKKVGIITGGKKQYDKPITIATYQSLLKIPSEWFSDINMLITDEFHHCLNGDSQIITDKGLLSISKIVNDKIQCKVKSYNSSTNKIEWKSVKKYWKYPRKGNGMIKITYEDEEGNTKSLTCTKNHKIYTKNRGYVVSELLTTEDDIVVLSKKYHCKHCDYSTDNFGRLGAHSYSKHNPNYKKIQKQCALNMLKSPNWNGLRARKLNSLSKMGDKNVSKRPEVREKRSKQHKEWFLSLPRDKQLEQIKRFQNAPKYGVSNGPTILEKRIINLGIPEVAYTGDGKFWLGCGKKNMNPDFKIRKKRKVIEVGDTEYWHTKEDIQKRIGQYKSIDFKCLYLTDIDLKNNSDNQLNSIIKEFING